MLSKIIIGLYVITTSLALVVLKLGAKDGAPVEFLNNKVHFNLAPLAILGIIFYGISFILYMYLISKYDLGYIIPIATALVYILIFIASFFIFHEVFTLMKVIGIALIIIGLVVLNANK